MDYGRKYKLVWIIFVVATACLILPPAAAFIVNSVSGKTLVFNILGSSEWVTLTTFLVITYTAGNTYEKHVALKSGVVPQYLDKFLEYAGLKTKAEQPPTNDTPPTPPAETK